MTRKKKELHDRRAAIPEIRRIVEDEAPAMIEEAFEKRVDEVPAVWRELVGAMKATVHARAEEWRAKHPDDDSEERRGYYWHFAIRDVEDMLEYLMREIRRDIGVEQDLSLASMLLVSKAMTELNLELQSGGSADPRRDAEESRYRMLGALRALTPEFDDLHLRRFRAVNLARSLAAMTDQPTAEELQERIERSRATASAAGAVFDEEQKRRWFTIKRPVMHAVFARQQLAEIDERFEVLDPLVVHEEFAAAKAEAGGRMDGGDGRVGPVRAVARLAVMCGALDAAQRDDEDFDAAVERVRNNLLVTCSRIRKVLRDFPGER